jgi:hypothetical protein
MGVGHESASPFDMSIIFLFPPTPHPELDLCMHFNISLDEIVRHNSAQRLTLAIIQIFIVPQAFHANARLFDLLSCEKFSISSFANVHVHVNTKFR